MQLTAGSKPRLILHGGMPKTGTASIQSSFCTEAWASALNTVDIRVLGYPKNGNYSSYFNSLRGVPAWRSEGEHKAAVDEMSSDICDLVRTLPAGFSILISAEALGDIAVRDPNSLRLVRRYLDQYFSDIKVMFYLREPLSYACSRIQQDIKAGFPIQLALRGALAGCRSVNALRNTGEVFGSSNVVIRSFDPALMTSSDVVVEFASNVLGVQQTELAKKDEQTKSEVMNLGLTAEMLQILQLLYGERSLVQPKINGHFIRTLGRINWSGTKFGPSFFSGKDRNLLLAETDKARSEICEFMGFDIFPSYRPFLDTSVSVADGAPEVHERNAQLLQREITHQAKAFRDRFPRETSDALVSAGEFTVASGKAKDLVHQLLGQLYDLCERQTAVQRRVAKL